MPKVVELSWTKVGWRNLRRNPKRTLITAGGLAAGYFAVVFMGGWTGGIKEELIENATSLVGGQLEVHHSNYLPDKNFYDTIGGRGGVDVLEILETVDADPAVLMSAPRVYAGGLISSGESTSAAMLVGIDIQREIRVSRFLDQLILGRVADTGSAELMLGAEAARQLEVEVGEEVVLVAQGADGSLASGLLTLVGVFDTGLPELDSGMAVMPISDLQDLIVLPKSRIHEIAVAAQNPADADATARRLEAALAGFVGDISVSPWTELHPVVVDYVALSDSMNWIIVAIVFTVAVFGVANTMVLATVERRREFAVMLAIGATPRSVAGAVVAESLTIGLASLVIGSLVTFPLMIWWHAAPPSLDWLYGNTTMAGVLISPKLRIAFEVPLWILSAVVLLLTTIVAAAYPAISAARISPADTLSGP